MTDVPEADPHAPALPSILDLRLPQDLSTMTSGSPVLISVAVAKPPKASFFRARAGAGFSANLNLLDASKMGGEGMFAVGTEVVGVIPDQVRAAQLRLVVTNFGTPYLVPVFLPAADGRWNPWHMSLARALERAEDHWIRISANMKAGSYDVFQALGHLGEPRWPQESFDELLELGFRDRIIADIDHPLVQQLLGKA